MTFKHKLSARLALMKDAPRCAQEEYTHDL